MVAISDFLGKSVSEMLLQKKPIDPYGGMASQPFATQQPTQNQQAKPASQDSVVQSFLKNNFLAPALVKKEKQYDQQALLNNFQAQQANAGGMVPTDTLPQNQPMGQQPMTVPTGKMPAFSNTHNFSSGMQPNSMQALNPYAGMNVPSVDTQPFQAQQQALQKQGTVMEKAYQEKGKADQAFGQQQQQFYQGQQVTSKQNLEEYKTQTADYNTQLTEINKQFPLLNRQQVIENMDTGKKVMASVGMVLGGIGAGMTGQKNAAIEAFNQNVDSIIQTNTQNYQRSLETLNAKRAKSATDFEMARQNLAENTAMQAQIFNGIKQQIDAKFMEESAPAERYKLESMSAQVMQELAKLQTQSALQGFNFKMEERKWLLSMEMNKNAVNVGTDPTGRPIKALAVNEKAADILRVELPKEQARKKSVQDMIAYIDASKSSGGGVKTQILTGNALEAMKQNIAMQFGLDAKTLPDIKKTFGSDSVDFYRQLLGQADQSIDNLINTNTIR